MSRYLNVAFYKFVALTELPALRDRLRAFCADRCLRGTILLSEEGINAFLAGEEAAVRKLLALLSTIPGFAEVCPKESWSSELPFARMLVKLKREIIPMGRPDIRPHERTGRRLEPAELKRWLDEGRELILLDTRNDYEIRRGTFAGAKSFGLRNFRELGEKLKAADLGGKPVVMFCTGGIRCEKATALALSEGWPEESVFQLDGGILKYFEDCGGEHFTGECFVFDNRGAVDAKLAETETGYGGASAWTAGKL